MDDVVDSVHPNTYMDTQKILSFSKQDMMKSLYESIKIEFKYNLWVKNISKHSKTCTNLLTCNPQNIFLQSIGEYVWVKH